MEAIVNAPNNDDDGYVNFARMTRHHHPNEHNRKRYRVMSEWPFKRHEEKDWIYLLEVKKKVQIVWKRIVVQ